MGIVCKICQKKQSGWIQDFPLTERHLNLRICAECYEHLNGVKIGRNIDIEKIIFTSIYLPKILPAKLQLL